MDSTSKPQVDLSKYNNEWYEPGSRIKRLLWYLCNLIFLKNYWFPFNRFKVFILRLFGAQIGRGLVLKPNVNVKYPWFLKVGDHCWIGEDVWIDNLDLVELKSNVCLSQGAMLLSGNHNYKKRHFDLIVKPITIHDGAWIGAKTIVTQGVVAGSHSVLAAGSVATQDLEPYTVYQGNPAKAMKSREMKTEL